MVWAIILATPRKSPRIREKIAKQNYPLGTLIRVEKTRDLRRILYTGKVEKYDPGTGLYRVFFQNGEWWQSFDESEIKKLRVPPRKSPKKKQPTKRVPTKASSKSSTHKQYRPKTQSSPSPNVKHSQVKRLVGSRPTSVNDMKDRTVRTKFELCAKNISELQNCNTMEDEAARNFHPKSQHIMFTYDELVQDPENANYGITRREEPIMIFLIPEGMSVQELGSHLIRIGTEMIKGSGKGYHICSSPEEYRELLSN